MFKKLPLRELLKVMLPHQAEFIEQNDPALYHFPLDELKDKLLAELKAMLDGKDGDDAAIDRAKRITDKVREFETEAAENPVG